jgi:hypothetical protein
MDALRAQLFPTPVEGDWGTADGFYLMFRTTNLGWLYKSGTSRLCTPDKLILLPFTPTDAQRAAVPNHANVALYRLINRAEIAANEDSIVGINDQVTRATRPIDLAQLVCLASDNSTDVQRHILVGVIQNLLHLKDMPFTPANYCLWCTILKQLDFVLWEAGDKPDWFQDVTL